METKISIKKIYAIKDTSSNSDFECAFTSFKRAMEFCADMREKLNNTNIHVIEIETITHTTEKEMF